MNETTLRNAGLLTLRLGVGGLLVAHGSQKLFGWFGGHGIAGTGGFFESIGFKPGKANAIAAGLGEAGGGALLALGLATPMAGAAAAGTMGVAASVHAPKFWATEGGMEYAVALGAAAASIALAGPGDYSLDAALGHKVNRGWMRAVSLGLVGPAIASVIIRRKKALAAAPAPEPGTATS